MLLPHSALLFGAVVVVPWAWLLRSRTREQSWPMLLQLLPALFLAPALYLMNVWLALPYLMMNFAAAILAARRIVARGLFPFSELAIDAAGLFFAVGGIWVVAYISGRPLLGFSGIWSLLTAIHFHYAGVVLPLTAGFLARKQGLLARLAAFGVVAGVPLTAIGITAGPPVEAFTGAITSAAGLLTGIVLLRTQKVFLVLAGLSLLVSMPLAFAWALATTFATPTLDLLHMIRVHGAINAFLFAPLVLIGWSLDPPDVLADDVDVPFSRHRGRGLHIGPRFFEVGSKAHGLVNDLDELAHPSFDPSKVHPLVRKFYEHTDRFTLLVTPSWHPAMSIGGKVWRSIARRIGQLELPVDAPNKDDVVGSKIFELDAAYDGRTNPRAWVRTFGASGRAMYVAAYATHRRGKTGYMNIAFPLPFANLTSVLRMNHAETDAILLTTGRSPGGDEGIWISTPLGPIKTPLWESILVRAVDGGRALQAVHVLTLFGFRYLTLEYQIAEQSRENSIFDVSEAAC